MKESRLFKIIYSVLDKGRVTAPELAKELEVSVRTIYRDIDALSGAGIPIYAEPARSGGISILENFVLDKMVLSEEEKKVILSSLQSLSIVNYVEEEEILRKLSALFHIPVETWFEVDFLVGEIKKRRGIWWHTAPKSRAFAPLNSIVL